MRLRQTIPTLLAASAMVGACGMNALRVQSAGTVGSLAANVSTEATRILNDAQKRRIDALTAIVASDPSCELVTPIWIYAPDENYLLKPGETLGAAPLCSPGKVAEKNQDGTLKYKGYVPAALAFDPIDQDAIKPTIDLIAALSVYGQALEKVVNEPKADISKELDDALNLVEKAKAQASALGLLAIPKFGGISKEQKDTAVALIQMIYDLAREQRQVKAIAKIHEKHSTLLGVVCPVEAGADPCTASEGILSNLSKQVNNWAEIVTKGASQTEVEALQRAYRQESGKLGFEARRAFVLLIMEARQEPKRISAASKAFGESVVALSAANQTLGRLLNNPTAEDKAKASQITQQRLTNALILVLSAVSAWKGI